MSDVDKSSEPPSKADIDEALSTVQRAFVKYIVKLPPEIAVQLPNIARCLSYLKTIDPR